MSYYQGDFYRGDFYRGDPGFFSFLGGLAKSAAGFIPGVGPVAQAGIGALTTKLGSGGMASAATSLVRRGVAAVKGHPVLSAAGAAGVLTAGGAMAGRETALMGAPGMGRKGYHMSKARKGHPSHLVRNRRMNVCNPRALRRSIRRAHGFAKLAMRTIHIVHPKKKGRFGGFRRRRTRARS